MREKDVKNHKKPLEKSKKSAGKVVENSNKKVVQKPKKSKKSLGFTIFGLLFMAGGAALVAAFFLVPGKISPSVIFGGGKKVNETNNIYSKLTGLALKSEAEVSAPAYCVQMPNGLDGARPQAGMNEAGVVFEAIAEAGITRFAAMYQNPTSAVIGPIRSLRTYYLEWDTPFDCAIVHAGGSGDALAAVSRGYKDLTEDYQYMYRGTYGGRLWNNLFTTSAYLSKFSANRGYTTSDIQGFSRMTPEESSKARVDGSAKEKLVIYEPSTGHTAEFSPAVPDVAINFGGYATFNVRYNYDAATNTYLRSYADGQAHSAYNCPAEDLGEKNPEDYCTLKQLAPAVIVAMVVSERRASDDYHEDITTVGSGHAYIFQNGTAIQGTWKKPSVSEQIRFYDELGAEIALAPGQTFVEAVPGYGSVEY